ncbi:hypothetical protein BC831DRAFT_465614 [Entophlyctis helioformis]|nr:hypothetical protein BC831DRAFT_465614 [Entophlyctis helioformis]
MSQQLLRSRMVLSVPVGPIATATAESASPMAASPLPSPPVSPAPCASRLYSPTSPAVRSTLAMSAAPLLHRLPNDLHALVAGSHCVSTPPASFDASSLLAAILNKDMLLGRPGNDNNDDSDSNDSDDSDVYAAAIDTLTAQLQSQSLPSHPSTPTLHLLFGYGSLINPASRRRTFSKDTIGIPVAVRGFQRSWSYACPRRQYTAVAVERVAGSAAITNGVLIPVPEPHIDLPRLDDRERNYSRGVIDLDDVQFLSPRVKQRLLRLAPNVIIWVYEISQRSTLVASRPAAAAPLAAAPLASAPKPASSLNTSMLPCASRWLMAGGATTDYNTQPTHDTRHASVGATASQQHQQQQAASSSPHKPCRHIPIPQSYVDCILDGCLRFGSEFARLFIASTHGWDGRAWLDDRHACVTQRKYVPNAEVGETPAKPETLDAVDRLLSASLPLDYRSRISQ